MDLSFALVGASVDLVARPVLVFSFSCVQLVRGVSCVLAALLSKCSYSFVASFLSLHNARSCKTTKKSLTTHKVKEAEKGSHVARKPKHQKDQGSDKKGVHVGW